MKKVIAVVGPTAVGKTKLSIALAKKYNGEIINADSTQVYKKMNIATAKVTEDEKEGISHHLLDIKEIDEDYTVYDFQKDCTHKIEEIFKRGKTPILVGGTGLYIKAVLYDYQFEKEAGLKISYEGISNEKLYEKLLRVDPHTTIHPNNRKRVERALTYYQINKKPFSEKEKNHTLLYDTFFIGLTTERDILYKRIDNRVDQMVEEGLLEEAEEIYKSKIRSKAVLTPIGYKELFPYFAGCKSLDACLDKLKQNSRRYAKRQYTWFSHQMDVVWFHTDYDCFQNTIDEVINYIERMS